MEDILGKLTEEQKLTLKQLRKNLEDILTPDHTDYHLVKFLRAKNFNLEESEKIFRVNYNNRRTFGVNTILETYEKPEVIKRYETIGILGFAKNGTLVHYVSCGTIDFYGFIMSMSCCDLCLYFSHMMEYDLNLIKEENKKHGKNIQEVTCVLDFEGFSIHQVLHQCVIEMGLDFVSLLQDTYPESWGHVLMVNVPGVFDKAFSLFKPVLRANVLERLRVADKSSTKKLLLEYIDEDVLPAFLGGKRVDSNGDPRCSEFITFGGKVPENLYSQYQRIPLMPTDLGVTCVTVRQRSVYNYCFSVLEAESKLRFQMRSENGSISVTLFFKEFDSDSNKHYFPGRNEYIDEDSENCKYEKMSVEIREQAHCTQEDFTITLHSAGMYIVRLSNTRNWFTSRKLFIKSEVFPPEQTSVS